jgi:hypothetical protein
MPLMNMVAGAPGDQFHNESSAGGQRGHPLGSMMAFADGRRYKYGRAGATALLTARLCQQTLNDANFDELVVPTARAIGDREITLTTGSTAATVDQFKDGYLNVEDDAGEGYLYTIKSNGAAATTATLTIQLYEELQIAWTTATTCGIFVNPMALVIVHPSPATAMLVGVTPRAFPLSTYGWFQTWGPCSVLVEGTHVINERVIDSASADGACAPTASTAAGEENYVGKVMEVAATTEEGIVFLDMA